MLKDQIKSEYPNISEADLMKKCMQFFKDQFISSFKDDSFMGSAKDSEEGKSIYAGEGQYPDEDITSEDFEFHDEQMAKFWVSLNEGKGKNRK